MILSNATNSEKVTGSFGEFAKKTLTENGQFVAGKIKKNTEPLLSLASKISQILIKSQFGSQICFAKKIFQVPLIHDTFEAICSLPLVSNVVEFMKNNIPKIPKVSEIIEKLFGQLSIPGLDLLNLEIPKLTLPNFDIKIENFLKDINISINFPSFNINLPKVPEIIKEIVGNFNTYLIATVSVMFVGFVCFNLFSAWKDKKRIEKESSFRNSLSVIVYLHPIKGRLMKWFPYHQELIEYLSHGPSWNCILIGTLGLIQIYLLSRFVYLIDNEMVSFFQSIKTEVKNSLSLEFSLNVQNSVDEFVDSLNVAVSDLETSILTEMSDIQRKAEETVEIIDQIIGFLDGSVSGIEQNTQAVLNSFISCGLVRRLNKVRMVFDFVQKLSFTFPRIPYFKLETFNFDAFNSSMDSLSEKFHRIVLSGILHQVRKQLLFFTITLGVGLLLPLQCFCIFGLPKLYKLIKSVIKR